MTFKDAYQELLDLADKPDVAATAHAKRAINRALLWSLNQHDFLNNETYSTTTITPEANSVDLTSLCSRIKAVQLADETPVDIITYGQLKAVHKRQLNNYPIGDTFVPDYIEQGLEYHSKVKAVVTGGSLSLYPAPTVTTTIGILYQKKFTDLTTDVGTHFLLDAGFDAIVMRCLIGTFRTRLSEATASKFTSEIFAVEWENLLRWDANLRSGHSVEID